MPFTKHTKIITKSETSTTLVMYIGAMNHLHDVIMKIKVDKIGWFLKFQT